MNEIKELMIIPIEVKDAADFLNYAKKVGRESNNLTFGEEGPNKTIAQEMAFLKNQKCSKRSIMLLGKIEGELVAVGSLSDYANARIKHRGELGLSVLRKYWNRGIGTKVMERLIAFAKEEARFEIIQLEVNSDNAGAIHLYKKFGFEIIGRYKKFFKIDDVYFDAYLMNLYL
ncbi:MAG: GNAT family protein [Eubacterium sp.]